MTKTFALIVCTAMLGLTSTHSNKRFPQYRSTEVYEVRPDIEMTPFYSTQGEICRVVLEKRHYSSTNIDLRNMSRKQIDQIFDELAPRNERGKPASGSQDDEDTIVAGVSEVTVLEYENISIKMYRSANEKQDRGYPVAVLDWKKRKCR